MKINLNQKILSTNLILMPYREHHVPKYHKWMKSEELQKLTASEPLSLEQEYAMQKSWRDDEDKCTFIILDRSKYHNCKEEDEIESMIGDTNLFIIEREPMKGEIEIMIAEISARGKKYGFEGLILMLLYGINFININTFVAKISFDNIISMRMFNKIGFTEISRSEVFKEVTLEKVVTTEWTDFLNKFVKYEIQYC